MNRPTCNETTGKSGKTRDGMQRSCSNACHKTISAPKPLGGKATLVDDDIHGRLTILC